MAFEVMTTGSLQHKNLSLLVVGPPGVGKTPFALTAPKPFLLNAEAGTASVAHVNANMAKIDSTKLLLEIRNVLALDREERDETLGFEVETVILDTIDEIQRIMIHERLRATKKTEMQAGDWMWLADEMNAIARGFRGLDMNVIFVCHTKILQEGETGEVRQVPDMSGAFSHQLPAAVDVVGRIVRRSVLDPDDVEVTHHYFVSGYDRHHDWLKNRGRLPNSLEMNFHDDYQRIHDMYFDGMEIEEAAVRTIESAADTEPPQEDEEVEETPPQKTRDEARQQIEDAQKVMADAEAKAAEAKSETEAKPEPGTRKPPAPVLTEPSMESPINIDLSEYPGRGEPVEDDAFTTAGFSLLDTGELRKAQKTRFFYRLKDGTEVLSVNELEGKAIPIPNPAVGTNIFCQVSGVEVTKNQASVSRVKYRKVFSEEVFAEHNNAASA